MKERSRSRSLEKKQDLTNFERFEEKLLGKTVTEKVSERNENSERIKQVFGYSNENNPFGDRFLT